MRYVDRNNETADTTLLQVKSSRNEASCTCYGDDTLHCQLLGHNTCCSIVDLQRSIANEMYSHTSVQLNYNHQSSINFRYLHLKLVDCIAHTCRDERTTSACVNPLC